MTAQKQLLAQNIDIVKNLPPGKSHAFTIEGASVLEAFVHARSKQPELSSAERALHQKITNVLRLWNHSKSTPQKRNDQNGTEKRHQLILRAAIDKVKNEKFSEITEEDIKLLHATKDLLEQRNEKGGHSNPHLCDLLTKTIVSLDKHKNKIAQVQNNSVFDTENPTEHMTTTSKVVNDLMADEVFEDIQVTSLNIVEDVDIKITARIFEYTGETVISGDIPKDVMVKVNKGGITVNGFVTGYLIADNDITVHGNIQGGGAITNTGSIKLERSLLNTTLIAKCGDITCEHIEAPDTCFAWGTLTIDGPCMGGDITAGHIIINGKAMAGTFQSCGHVKVDSLETSKRAPTVVYLSNTIECKAYNREMSPKMLSLGREVNANTKEIKVAEEKDSFTLHMIYTAYRTALFYLFGGVDSASTAIDLQGHQTKALYLSRLIGFAEEYEKFYTEAYDNREDFDSETITDFVQSAHEAFTLIKEDIAAIPEDFGSTHRQFLQDRCGEYTYMSQKLKREFEVDDDSTFLKKDFVKFIDQWRKYKEDTNAKAQELIDSFGLDKELLKRMKHEPETLEELLDSTTEKLESSTDPEDARRLKSPLMRLLKTTACRLKRSIEMSHTKISEYRRSINLARKELLDSYAVQYRDTVPGGCSLVAGHIAPEVIITASKLSRRGRDTNMAKVIVLSKPIENETEFHLWENMVQRQA